MLALREQRQALQPGIQVAQLPAGPVVRMEPIPDGSTYAQAAAPARADAARRCGGAWRMEPDPAMARRRRAPPGWPIGRRRRRMPAADPAPGRRGAARAAGAPGPPRRSRPRSAAAPLRRAGRLAGGDGRAGARLPVPSRPAARARRRPLGLGRRRTASSLPLAPTLPPARRQPRPVAPGRCRSAPSPARTWRAAPPARRATVGGAGAPRRRCSRWRRAAARSTAPASPACRSPPPQARLRPAARQRRLHGALARRPGLIAATIGRQADRPARLPCLRPGGDHRRVHAMSAAGRRRAADRRPAGDRRPADRRSTHVGRRARVRPRRRPLRLARSGRWPPSHRRLGLRRRRGRGDEDDARRGRRGSTTRTTSTRTRTRTSTRTTRPRRRRRPRRPRRGGRRRTPSSPQRPALGLRPAGPARQRATPPCCRSPCLPAGLRRRARPTRGNVPMSAAAVPSGLSGFASLDPLVRPRSVAVDRRLRRPDAHRRPADRLHEGAGLRRARSGR